MTSDGHTEAGRSAAGADLPPPLRAALLSLIAGGDRIAAIKRYRTATRADLVTAKDVVDRLAAGTPLQAGGTGAQRGWRVQASVPFTLARAVGLTRLFALFLWLCALLAALAAGWQAYERDTIRRSWPVADADVVACRPVEHHAGRRRIDLLTLEERGPPTSLVCRFRYSVDGRQLEAETRSHSSDALSMVGAMHSWAAAHRPGTHQPIHYDPADAQRISLGDADQAFEPDTVEHREQLALLFGAGGIALYGISLWLAAIQRRREASSV